MMVVTGKSFAMVNGRPKGAVVSVLRADLVMLGAPPTPEIVLNGHGRVASTAAENALVEATQLSIRQVESELGWQGFPHYLVKIEGLLVDGIDTGAAIRAAREATKASVQG